MSSWVMARATVTQAVTTIRERMRGTASHERRDDGGHRAAPRERLLPDRGHDLRLVRQPHHALPARGRRGQRGGREPGHRVGDRGLRALSPRAARARRGGGSGRVRRPHRACDPCRRAGRHRDDGGRAGRARRGRGATHGLPAPAAHRGDGPDDPAPGGPGTDDGRALAAGLPVGPPHPAGPRDTGPVLGRGALLPRCLDGAAPPQRRHEHAHRARHERRLRLLRGGHRLPPGLPRGGHGRRRGRAPLLRHLERDHHAHPPGPLPRGARADPHVRRHPSRSSASPRGRHASCGAGSSSTCPSRPCSWASSCASDRARPCPSTGSSSRAARASTRAW